jgi:hypothetical protein
MCELGADQAIRGLGIVHTYMLTRDLDCAIGLRNEVGLGL